MEAGECTVAEEAERDRGYVDGADAGCDQWATEGIDGLLGRMWPWEADVTGQTCPELPLLLRSQVIVGRILLWKADDSGEIGVKYGPFRLATHEHTRRP